MKIFFASLKIIFLLVFTIAILNIKKYLFLTRLLFILFIFLWLTPSKKLVFRRLKILLPIALMIFVLQIFFNQSQSFIWRIEFAYSVFIRIAIVSLIVLFFMTVVSTSEIIIAFWFLPKNIKLLLTMTFYFIPIIFQESEQIILVQKSRGLKTFSWNIAPLIIPLLHRVFLRAELLALTIISRGYNE
ncbi:hypothetical protein COY88_01640 [Candidatus Roizmanbacteria bacterium CG_4_10_14_0_8_um_filter_35_28]|uniref:Energy-coupling factor transporter transmembrane protein EcfT n=1 Tax=Candidatus Roizmanbacteria bacterium CG_4_10_14_0_8_um_filter_35_28 TaxID=1974827 RepID=A0A2M7QGY2_9BACT|nr:MAG: hypothetical protein COY88_01640 [Candidatus Roizmanbacteria bacterium CG_4_10_14_0_8_um_filter_35_28]